MSSTTRCAWCVAASCAARWDRDHLPPQLLSRVGLVTSATLQMGLLALGLAGIVFAAQRREPDAHFAVLGRTLELGVLLWWTLALVRARAAPRACRAILCLCRAKRVP